MDSPCHLRHQRLAWAGERARKQYGQQAIHAHVLEKVQRCNALTGEDKIACEARIVGYGNTQGSVAGGGVIREVETVVLPRDATNVVIQPQTANDAIIVIPAPQ